MPAPAIAIALTAIACLILYNTYLKRVPLIGNLTVSALGSLAFLYGGAAVENMSAPYLIAGFAFLFHLARELLKDLEDSAGDRQLSGGTVPISWGENIARILITGIFTILIIATPLPALLGIYSSIYLSLILLLNLLLIFVLIRLWQNNALGFLNKLLKAGHATWDSPLFFLLEEDVGLHYCRVNTALTLNMRTKLAITKCSSELDTPAPKKNGRIHRFAPDQPLMPEFLFL